MGIKTPGILRGGERENLAVLHKPKTHAEMRVAVREMANRGMTELAISHASGLSIELVRRWLGESTIPLLRRQAG